MDRLARNAMLAKQANMSYGKWKAMQPIVPVEKKAESQEGWIKCAYCGKAFKPHNPQQKYCEYACRERGYAEKESEIQRKYREKRKAERRKVENDESCGA